MPPRPAARTSPLLPMMAPMLIGAACAFSGWGNSEGAVVVLFVAAAFTAFGFDMWIRGNLRIPTALSAYVGVAVLAVACVSAVASGTQPLLALFGTSPGVGTIEMFAFFALAILLGSCGLGVAAFLYTFEAVTMLRALVVLFSAIAQHASFSGLLGLTVEGFAACMLVSVIALGLSRKLQMGFFHGVVALSCFLAIGALFLSSAPGSIQASAASMPSASVSARVLGLEDLSSPSNALIGAGPQSFDQAWNTYRPLELNATPLWKTVPDSAQDTVLTFAITIGLLGVLAFLLCPLVLLYAWSRRMALSSEGVGALRVPIASLVVASFCAAILYQIGPSLFILSGASLGYCLYLTGTCRHSDIELPTSVRVLAVPVMCCIAVVLAVIASVQLIALRADDLGHTIEASNEALASVQFQRAADIWPTPYYMKDAAQAVIASSIQAANAQIAVNSLEVATLAHAVTQAEGYSDRSAGPQGDNNDADLLIARASVYLSLASIGVPGATTVAQKSLADAQSIAPTRVDVLYDEAVLAIFNGDTDLARAYLYKALDLKPDYQGASDLLATIGS